MTLAPLRCEPIEQSNRKREDDVAVLEMRDRDAWERYLDGFGARAIYHRWAWGDVLSTYDLPVMRLAAVCRGRITGVLPLVRQQSRLFGDRLVSLPWFDAAGIIADSEGDRRALADAAVRRGESMRVGVVEIRQSDPVELSPHVRTDKVLMRLALEPDWHMLWNRLRPKVRNQIRKGEKSGLLYSSGSEELLPEFFDVYSRNMRDLGSPSHDVRLFEATCRAFPETARLHVVRLRNRTVGAAFTLEDGAVVEVPWASSLREFNGLCVNHVLYWNLLREACHNGCGAFHFGRSSRDSGTYHFKRQWGAEEAPLYWYYLGRETALAVARGPREAFAWATAVWRRLPMCVARRLGPRVISKVS